MTEPLTFLYTSKINGIEHTQIMKGCRPSYVRGQCNCGFFRHAFKRFLNHQQTLDLKHHLACTAGKENHIISVRMNMTAAKAEPPFK